MQGPGSWPGGGHGRGAWGVGQGVVLLPEKGFGFVIPDVGCKDVFVSGRTLERFGLAVLEPNQRVRLQTRMGQKGPMAEQVELL
jgi:CspA family cold shock protein